MVTVFPRRRLSPLVDDVELRVRRAEMRLEQLRHEAGLKHAYLQQRFLLALTLAAGIFVATLRTEVPQGGVLFEVPLVAWALAENRSIRRLSIEENRAAEALIAGLDARAPEDPQPLRPQGDTLP